MNTHDIDLDHWISLPHLSTGRRMIALNQIRIIAVKRNLPDLVARVDLALAHELRTRELENRWARRSRGSLYNKEVPLLDRRLDPVIASIRDIALGHVAGLPPDDELAAAVRVMLDDVFPAGPIGVTSLPYADQAAATEVVLDKLQTTHAALIERLGMNQRVALLAELTRAYRAVIDQSRDVVFTTVDRLRRRGRERLMEIIAMTLGRFYDSDDPAHVTARSELLHPVLEQSELHRLGRTRRRVDHPDAETPAADDADVTPDTPTGENPPMAPVGDDDDTPVADVPGLPGIDDSGLGAIDGRESMPGEARGDMAGSMRVDIAGEISSPSGEAWGYDTVESPANDTGTPRDGVSAVGS